MGTHRTHTRTNTHTIFLHKDVDKQSCYQCPPILHRILSNEPATFTAVKLATSSHQ